MNDNDTIVKTRPGEPDTKSIDKTEEPKEYQVIVNQDGHRDFVMCIASVLCSVFNQSPRQAVLHANKAADQGRDIVLTTTRDVAETRAEAANAELGALHSTCPAQSAGVSFTIEPAP